MKINFKYPIKAFHRLSGYTHEDSTTKHPAARLALHWRGVSTSGDVFINGIDFSETPASIDRYKAFLYECAELLESMNDISNSILGNEQKAEFESKHKKLRDDVGFIVNMLKHKDFELNSVAAVDPGKSQSVLGFVLCKPALPNGIED
jgi:hypothetical protein